MKVFGYNDQREVVEADLSIETIVVERINPYWVDLFDASPVMREVAGNRLAFTRLRNFVFQYAIGRKVTIGVLENGNFRAFEGDDKYGDQKVAPEYSYWLHNPRSVSIGFESAFSRFVEQYDANKTRSFRACQSGGLKVSGSTLAFDPEEGKYPLVTRAFAGRMFQGVLVPQKLPPAIAWVFSAFKDWNPMVVGGSLRDTMLGRTPKDVDFIVDSLGYGYSGRAAEEVEKRGATNVVNRTETDSRYNHDLEHPVISFDYEGTSYDLISRGNPLSDRFWALSDFSVNQLIAVRPDEVTASRIALWDLGHKQCRLVSLADETTSGGGGLRFKWPERVEKMRQKGFNVLPNLFSRDEYDDTKGEKN